MLTGWKKELIDQPLHILYAFIITTVAIFPVPPIFALLIGIAVGVERELEQHGWKGVGMRDIAFWSIGAILAIVSFT